MTVPLTNHPAGAKWKGFYDMLFPEPILNQDLRLSFDILNVDPTDSATGAVFAEEVIHSTIGDLGIVPHPSVSASNAWVFDFGVGSDNGFDFRSPPNAEDPVPFIDDDDGLNVVASIGQPQSNFVFGSWTKETNIQLTRPTPMTGYLLIWDVKSKININDRQQVPTFRLRVNDSSLARSWYINLDSTGSAPRVPTVGNPKTYYQWIEPPPNITDSTMILSFDFLWVNQGNLTDGAVSLKRLSIIRFE
jgi:hypothetical protein